MPTNTPTLTEINELEYQLHEMEMEGCTNTAVYRDSCKKLDELYERRLAYVRQHSHI